jgi:hypothetical protein
MMIVLPVKSITEEIILRLSLHDDEDDAGERNAVVSLLTRRGSARDSFTR